MVSEAGEQNGAEHRKALREREKRRRDVEALARKGTVVGIRKGMVIRT